MNKTSIAVLASLLALASVAQAQSQDMSPSTEIRESTDPAKIAEVERRAAEIMSQQQSGQGMDASSGASDSSTADRPMKERKHKSRSGRERSESRSGSGQ